MKELIFGLIGGTALLMYGVDKMGEGLEKASGNMMRKILSVLTGKVWSAFLVGTFLTALVQSSTAITVLTVGFVNAGLMKLPQAIGIIYGANIGTTITAQLMAFSFSFKLTDIALPVLGVGFLVSYFAKNKTLKNFGEALMGFGMMFLGLKILNSGIPFMKDNETLKFFFETYASIPVVGILLGAAATALVHSSSATVGLVMVLGQAGLIDIQTAVCIMLGDNIGTCITAQLASLTGNIHARRTAWAHTLYNIFGVALTWITLPLFVKLVEITTVYLQPTSDISAQIANSHTIFNLISALIFLPLTKYYVKFLETVITSKDEKLQKTMVLDRLLLHTPVAAIKATISEITKGTEVTKKMVKQIITSFRDGNENIIGEVSDKEAIVNQLQKDVIGYIVDISKQPLTDSESYMVPALMTGINNVERIGDHVMDISVLVNSSIRNNLSITEAAKLELGKLENVLMDMFDNTIKVFTEYDEGLISKIEALEDEVDRLCKEFEENHLNRLNNNECSIESGVVFLDIINHLERIADHIYKISLLTKENFNEMITKAS
ncbi:Na/Pi cotransporter family protein [Desnuesiella massiliensis]|uniref:Na/Pi cotransporter family protein n=1 Tax=Desnuesiella massiliensis TaxID=1650662 RepID=UPI0006E292E0|nr:Na/Pi cotransporter family protein [Desnuesiella massiliensis]